MQVCCPSLVTVINMCIYIYLVCDLCDSLSYNMLHTLKDLSAVLYLLECNLVKPEFSSEMNAKGNKH